MGKFEIPTFQFTYHVSILISPSGFAGGGALAIHSAA